jgi:hypothetical protein
LAPFYVMSRWYLTFIQNYQKIKVWFLVFIWDLFSWVVAWYGVDKVMSRHVVFYSFD